VSHSVAIFHDKSHKALEWAKENCPSYITNSVKIDYRDDVWEFFMIEFFFYEEDDATMFALRWR
jgi:hypothetical protein